MKKGIVLAIMVALVVVKSFAMTNTEIANILNMSKEANITNGIYNLDSIYPNQRFTVMFEDGITATVTVRKGDTGWGITEDIVSLSNVHGPIIDYPVGGNVHHEIIRPTQLPAESNATRSLEVYDFNSVVDLLTYILLICFVIIILLIYFISRNKIKYLKDKMSNQDKIIKLSQEKEELIKSIKETKSANQHMIDLEITELLMDRSFYNHIEKTTQILQNHKGGRVDVIIGNCMYTVDVPIKKKTKG